MEYLQGIIQRGLIPQNTVLMDETAIYLEDPRRITINASGKRHVVLKSTGFASMRITIILAVGRNLKIITNLPDCQESFYIAFAAHTF